MRALNHTSLSLMMMIVAVFLWSLSDISVLCLQLFTVSSHKYFSTSTSHISTYLGSDHGSFDCTEQTIDSIHALLYGGRVSCRDIVQGYLAKIEALNPRINAIIAVNNQSLIVADRMDHALRTGGTSRSKNGALFCIPVLLKDNYETMDMPTTAGSISLAEFQPIRDAPVVTRLKDAGAIVLGKTNMHEFALEGLSVSSLGGQTCNPYDLTRTPGGSSGGSGAAVAASFSTFATGSDTVNSIRSPSASNSLFGIRPSKGLISRNGIIPLGYSQDTIGPIARTPRDLAIAFDVMVGQPLYDAADNLTALSSGHTRPTSYVQALSGKALSGARIGILTTLFGHDDGNETTIVNQAIWKAINTISDNGATFVNITIPLFNSAHMLAEYDVQRFEFPSILTEYLEKQGAAVPYSSFDGIYASQKFLPLCYSEVLGDTMSTSIKSDSYARRLSDHNDLRVRLFDQFSKYHLDAVIYPEQQNLVVPIGAPSQKGRNGILAALSGFPVVVVPAGFSSATLSAPLGLPIGLEILGLPYSEAKLLDLAFSYDLNTKIRRTPMLAQNCISGKDTKQVPSIKPNRTVDPAYLEYPPGF